MTMRKHIVGLLRRAADRLAPVEPPAVIPFNSTITIYNPAPLSAGTWTAGWPPGFTPQMW